MYSQYTVSGYNITTDPSFQNERFNNSEELIEQFNELYIESQNKKNKKIIAKLTDLIVKYPQSPQLKNFLSAAYSVQGNNKKASEVNNWTLSEHPDYLFARLNLANDYINDGKAEKVPEVLGEAMEIKGLYPERHLFHLAEVTGFYKVAVRYYASINNLELAENRWKILNEIAQDHPDTVSAESFLFALRMEKSMERLREAEAASIKVVCAKPPPSSNQKASPVFNNAEINYLYQYGLKIPVEKLKQILALPRETVIVDLEKVLLDAIDRYLYFLRMGNKEETHSSPLHAICLLGELRSDNSLPAVLNFLENNEEVLEFWLGDHLTSTIWLPVYLLSTKNPVLLKDFLIKPGISTYAKVPASEALCQMVLHEPGKINNISALYKEVLSYFNHADLKDNIIDSTLLGLIIGDIMDCDLMELLPPIKQLFDKKYVDTQVNGTYKDVEEYLKNPWGHDHKKNIVDIFDLYDSILKTWFSYSEDNEFQQPVFSVKVGRNDPCPCGSGKKYKKCCKDK